MPYIEKNRRKELDGGARVENAGELNYMITRLIMHYDSNHGGNYRVKNDVMGALTGALNEYYRRVVAPYEDEKRLANGDVYY